MESSFNPRDVMFQILDLGCQEGHQRQRYSPFPDLDPWRTGGS